MLFFLPSFFCRQFGREIMCTTIVKSRIHKILHKVVGTIQKLVIIRNKLYEPFQLVKLCFLFHSKKSFWGLWCEVSTKVRIMRGKQEKNVNWIEKL